MTKAMHFARRAWILAPLLLLSCSYAGIGGFAMTTDAQAEAAYFVEHQPKDTRALDEVLADDLRARGLRVVASKPDADYAVSYIDKWYWDMRMYMVDFRVDIRDARTNVLVGTGRSFQTSIDAMGHSYQEIMQSALSVALDGPQPHVARSGKRRCTGRERRMGRCEPEAPETANDD